VTKLISLVIPNYNGSHTIAKCLESALACDYPNFEVIVIDDCSNDNSIAIIEKYPCKLINLTERSGAARTRNIGARNSRGEILFFIDADCLLKKDALTIAAQNYDKYGPGTIIGGTYTPRPYDKNFFSMFQSIFIHYSETKNSHRPDYLATHAMIIDSGTFKKSGGFSEKFMPILEDVEFSHRLKKNGYELIVNPDILVTHIFNFSLTRSLKNGIRKSMYWTAYSMQNKDMFADSGTASVELKTNVFSILLVGLSIVGYLLVKEQMILLGVIFIFSGNILVNRRLLNAFFKTGGTRFGLAATFYYTSVYPFAVAIGVSGGILKFLTGNIK